MATLAVAVHWSSVILLSCWIMLDAWIGEHKPNKLNEFGLFEYHTNNHNYTESTLVFHTAMEGE